MTTATQEIETMVDPHQDRRNWIAVVALLLSLITMVVTAMHSYGNDSGDFRSRLSVVETQQKNSADRMERIENKIDRILEHMR